MRGKVRTEVFEEHGLDERLGRRVTWPGVRLYSAEGVPIDREGSPVLPRTELDATALAQAIARSRRRSARKRRLHRLRWRPPRHR